MARRNDKIFKDINDAEIWNDIRALTTVWTSVSNPFSNFSACISIPILISLIINETDVGGKEMMSLMEMSG